MNEQDKGPKVRTHTQVTVSERRRMPQGLNERHRKNPELRPSWTQRRSGANTRENVEARHPKFKFNVPDWLLPKNGVHIFNTITASIVWGICGRMADMPEYGGES